MIITFIRHADSKKDKLTKLGKLQCKFLAKQKDNIVYSKIYCSPANRCIKTARFLQNKYKIKTEVCENFREREHLENNTPTNEMEQEWYDNYLNPLYSSENPEGCKEYLTRTFVEIKRIIDENFDSNQNVIIVAHSGTFYALTSYIYGLQKGKNVKWVRLNNCAKVSFEIKEKE